MFGGFKPFEQLRAEAEAKAAKGIEAKTAKGREEERQLALCRQERDVKRQMPWKEMLSNSQKTRQLKMQKQELKIHAQTAKFFLGNDFLRLQIDRLAFWGVPSALHLRLTIVTPCLVVKMARMGFEALAIFSFLARCIHSIIQHFASEMFSNFSLLMLEWHGHKTA